MTDANSWTGRCGFYAASLLRLGNFIDAGFVAAVLFEKFIDDELHRHGLERGCHGDFIFSAIDTLHRIDPLRYPARKLHEIREIRNQYVVHANDAFDCFDDPAAKLDHKKHITKLVDFVWQKMEPVSYRRFESPDRIPLLHADYALTAVREYLQNDDIEISPFESQIGKADFEDLMHLRKHFLQLSGFLNQGLMKNYPNLELDIVSSVDATSGYVWLAADLRKDGDDHLRDRVRQASASVIATPLDLRISIEFGGEAHTFREDYYSFLKTDEFKGFVARNDDLVLFDVDWYSSIIKRVPAAAYLGTENFYLALKGARARLKVFVEARRIIPWDRLLAGYIIPRQAMSYAGIAEKLEVIIELYYRFERFRRDHLKKEAPLTWCLPLSDNTGS